MKNYRALLFIVSIVTTAIPCWAQTPLEIVNVRMEAHNNHDIEKFLGTYSDDIRIYDYPDIKIGEREKSEQK